MDVFHQTNESILQIDKWQKLNPALRAGFTTRNGGVSHPPYNTLNLGLHVPDNHEAVISNRQFLAKNLGFSVVEWVSGEQTHQTNINIVNSGDKGKGAMSYETSLQQMDGLITKETGILCTAFFADCVPLFFFDPTSGYIGIAHAGWKGTVNRMAERMVEKLTAAGADTTTLLVAIGPSISQPFYEVDEHVIKHLDAELYEKTSLYKGGNRYLLDLKQLNAEILLQCGVPRNNIDVTNYCTFRDNRLFFSHRRASEKTGRMLGYIGYRA